MRGDPVFGQLRRFQDRLNSSLFFVPMVFVVTAAVLGEVMLLVDDRVESIPQRLTATVDSARAVLSVVAGATLTFAGIAFSVSLLLISLASGQFSPRVVHGLFRDPFNKRIMGIVIGTFTYSLVVLRAVRGPLEESSQPVVPSLSILLAVVLGVISVLSIVAFISHSAHSMDVSRILQRVTDEALAGIRDSWPESSGADDDDYPEPPQGDGFVVTFAREGWVQQIDHEALLDCLEPGSCLELATVAGRFAIPGAKLCTIWPAPEDEEGTRQKAHQSVELGETRTMLQDVTFGARQLADVALKALSPGINDPTTAQDALFHLAAVVREILVRDPPARRVAGDDGRFLLLSESVTHEELIGMAFDEVRVASAGQPTVQIYLLEILNLLTRSLDGKKASEAVTALRRQADLVLETVDEAALTTHDQDRVRAAHRRRFISDSGP
ncbi:MAG: DUF2254 domain-containing protein [Acidimicrobiia bacterium]|nr:DUF2254 domain-containing protein [Acidimicrobiia bacterium]